MPEQNFKNHRRLITLYHFVAYPLVLYPWVGSIINLVHRFNAGNGIQQAISEFSLITGVCLALWFARSFALRAQDRAIRAEENFRHFVATGKVLDNRLGMRQIIALRFAGDDEFVALAKKAAEENLSSKEIKMTIKNWKADHNRV